MVTLADKELSETAQKFFDFATSAEADALVKEAGVVPVKR